MGLLAFIPVSGSEVEALEPWRRQVRERIEAIPPSIHKKLGYVANDAPLDGGDGWILSGRRSSQLPFDSGADDEQGTRRLDLAEQALLRTHAELKSLGVRFVVMIAPDKSDVYPEKIAPLPEGVDRVTIRTKRLMDRLRARGVNIVDVEPVLRSRKGKESGPLYMKRDTHWAPSGARLAAIETAKVLTDLKRKEGDSKEQPGMRLKRDGDLAENWRRSGREAFPAEFHGHIGVARKNGKPLFSDKNALVWVLGDSYCVYPYDGHLSYWAFLADELGQTVRVMDRAGGGNAVLKRLRNVKKDTLRALDAVVLVVTNCSLYEEDYRQIKLLDAHPPPEPLRDAPVELMEDMPSVNPNTVDYDHALGSVRARVDRGDGVPVERELRVPILRDRTVLAAMGWKAGHRIRLDLAPLPTQEWKGMSVVGEEDPALPVLFAE